MSFRVDSKVRGRTSADMRCVACATYGHSRPQPGELRNTPQLRQTLEEQIEKAGKGLVGTWSAQATSTGVKDKLTSAACELLNEEYKQRIKEEDADEDEVLEEVDEIRREIVQEGKHLNSLSALR